jgi:hypothetical protein
MPWDERPRGFYNWTNSILHQVKINLFCKIADALNKGLRIQPQLVPDPQISKKIPEIVRPLPSLDPWWLTKFKDHKNHF